MAKLFYSMMASLDGYVCDANGDFDWGQISEEVHAFANAEMANGGTEIYGRRMYETMVTWESVETSSAAPPVERQFAKLWQDADKIVVSRTLDAVASARTRLVGELPVEAVEALKRSAGRNISVSGPTVAAPYLTAGLVDEIGVYTIPVLVGNGTKMFAPDLQLKLERVEVCEFENGVTFMRFRPRH